MATVKKQIENQEYMIGEISSQEELKENLKMNCIPESIYEMDAGDFQEFLKERRQLMMAQKIRTY